MLDQNSALQDYNNTDKLLNLLKILLFTTTTLTILALLYSLLECSLIKGQTQNLFNILPGQISALAITLTAERLVKFNDLTRVLSYNKEKYSAYLFMRAKLDYAYLSTNYLVSQKESVIPKIILYNCMEAVEDSFKSIYSHEDSLLHMGNEVKGKLSKISGSVLGISVLIKAMKSSDNIDENLDITSEKNPDSLRDKLKELSIELSLTCKLCNKMLETIET